MQIVFNSSPLIFLARLEWLEIFLDDPNDFYLPKSVANEIKIKTDRASQLLQRLIASDQLTESETRLTSLANSFNQRLGLGESEAIALSIELNADHVILDDFAARREASRLGLNVKGTLAIVKKLKDEDKICWTTWMTFINSW
jgi:predicted nucleic acid-binding protein